MNFSWLENHKDKYLEMPDQDDLLSRGSRCSLMSFIIYAYSQTLGVMSRLLF